MLALMEKENLLTDIPNDLPKEVIRDIIETDSVRIKRIISKGQKGPEQGWYDQDENEWVLVVQGAGILEFETGEQIELNSGDYLNIPAHKKHRVSWTDPKEETVWLAIFY